MIVCLLSVILTAVSTTAVYFRLFQNRVREDLRINLELLKGTGFFDNAENSTGIASIRTDDDDLRITWISSDGKVLYDNDNDIETLDNHLDRQEIQQALEKGTGESIRDSRTMAMNTHYYAELLPNGTILRVGSDAGNIVSIFIRVLPVILLAVLIIIVICVALSQYLTRQFLSPVEEMIDNIDSPDSEPAYSELKPFSEKIHRQYSEILEAASAREEFSVNVSHELKTPLTAIRGYGELIESDETASQTHRHFAHEIVRNATRLHTLIEDTIMLSKLDRHDLTACGIFRLDEVISHCTDLMQVNAREKNISIICQKEKAEIRGDEELITQLAENLIQNAITYNRPNGTVWITVKNEQDRCILTVRDNGIGIPEEDQKRVFERFYRVDKSRSRASGGTGLGLAIVKHIAEIHGAEISLTSKINKGTEITVSFPTAD